MSDTNPDNNVTQPRKKRRKRVRSTNKTTDSHCPVPGQTGLTTTLTGEESGLNEIPRSVNNSSCRSDSRIEGSNQIDDPNNSFALLNSQEYTETVMNPQLNMTAPTTDFAARNPFIPGSATKRLQPPSSTADPTSPPTWALPLLADIKSIKSEVVKIDKIEKSVNEIKLKMNEMETKVKSLETKVSDCEASCTFISNETEEHRNEMKTAKHDIDKLQKRCTHMNETIKRHEQDKEMLNGKILDLESRSMRENLMFYGIQETSTDNCEQLVKDLIRNKLEIDPTDIILDRVHRVGNEHARKPRPIVAKFHKYTERETIRKKAYEDECKRKLKQDNQGVGIQWPQQAREARRAFYAYTKEEERKGNRVKIIGTKLYVNNVLKRKYVDGNVCDANDLLVEEH